MTKPVPNILYRIVYPLFSKTPFVLSGLTVAPETDIAGTESLLTITKVAGL